MFVSVVDIRVMWVRVPHLHVLVPMFMGLLPIPGKVVAVEVMLVMHMPVSVIEHFMRMFVLMAFGKVQPNTHGHQATCQPEPRTGVFTQ